MVKPILAEGVTSMVMLSDGVVIVDTLVDLMISMMVSTGGVAVDMLVSSTVLSTVTVACEVEFV